MRFWLIAAGVLLIVLGLLWPLIIGSGLGRLPGDIAIHRRGVEFYFPITTCLIISVVVSLILWLIRR